MVSRNKKIASVSFLIASLVSLSGCGKPEEPPAVVRSAYVMTIGGPGAGETRSFTGTAKAQKEITMSFRVPGQITELNATVGQKVQPNDVVAKLDPKDAELSVSQRKASLSDAEAKLQRAKADYERIRQLYEAGSSSAAELDSALASFRSGQAYREASEKELELSQQQLKYTTLIAEVEGEITEVPVEVFETVAAGQMIAKVVSGDLIKMEIGIPELLLNSVRMNMTATITFDTFPEETFEAKVTEIGRSPTKTTTYPVTMVLDQQDKRIHPGMVGEATFRFVQKAGAEGIIVPASVVVGEGEKRYVWIFDPKTEVVHKRDVEVGSLLPGGLRIEKGLAIGDRIVTRGVHRVSEGMKVKPMEEK